MQMSVYVKHFTVFLIIFNIYFNENEEKTISIWFTTISIQIKHTRISMCNFVSKLLIHNHGKVTAWLSAASKYF